MTFGRLAVVLVVGMALVLPVQQPVLAAPSAKAVQADIDRLGDDIASLNEDYNEARIRLAKLESQSRDLTRKSAEAEKQAKTLRQVASRRAASVYQAGVPSVVVAFLSSQNAAEASRKMALVSRVEQWELGLMTDLTIAQERADDTRSDLQRSLAGARSVERTIARKRDGLEDRLATQRTLLAQMRTIRPVRAARPEPVVNLADLPPRTSAGARSAVAAAYKLLGRRYNYGSEGPDEFDCSGLTKFAWRDGGVVLPHSSRAQFAALPKVSRDALEPGDLVFYGRPIHHVGVYIGGGRMIHAPESGSTVEVSPALRGDYVGAARPG
jgi:peptidoglycan DL-endopeptidase CwlO